MWAFPCAVRHPDEEVGAGAERAAREGLGIGVQAGVAVGTVEHVFTHVRVSYHAIRCALVDGDPLPLRYEAWAWATPNEVKAYALPVAQQRIAALAAAQLATEPPG
jgi:A/G-specific adenine glycosylase